MYFKDFVNKIENTKEPENLEFGYMGYTYISGVMRRASLLVKSINDPVPEVIKFPDRAINKWGNEVDVSGFFLTYSEEKKLLRTLFFRKSAGSAKAHSRDAKTLGE